LRTHKLSGKLEGQWAFSVDDDCRVVLEFIGEDKVLNYMNTDNLFPEEKERGVRR